MKIRLLIVMVLFPVLGFAQAPRNNFFGIDLNLDWQSLTNYQQLTYYLIERDTPEEIPYIITDFEFSITKVDQRFLDLGFHELLLGFPKDGKTYSKDLKPQLFLARNSYSLLDYDEKSQSDIMKIKSLIVERYGEAGLNMVREEYSTYKWEGAFYQITLSTRVEDLTVVLLYFKN